MNDSTSMTLSKGIYDNKRDMLKKENGGIVYLEVLEVSRYFNKLTQKVSWKRLGNYIFISEDK